MQIKGLRERQDLSADPKTVRIYEQFGKLLNEMGRKELTEGVVTFTNSCVDEINACMVTGAPLTKLVKKKQDSILKLMEKEMKVVPRNYYRTLWMVLGMSGIGMPIGVAFGISVGNIGLLGLGLPIGMAIGLAIGSSLDKKAATEGRQLDIELKG